MKHVVSHPVAPLAAFGGAVEVHQVPAWRDNLIWLLVDTERAEAAAVDGPEAGPVLDHCARHGLRLTAVLNTHTHPDHVGINRDLAKRGLLDGMRVVGPARVADAVPGITEPVDEGDTVRFGAATGTVWLTEGHMDGHVSYLFDDVLFCGDALFTGGCGRLFDGPPAKMYAALLRFAELEGGTRVCCAHEYTEANLRFAQHVEPGNAALAARVERVAVVRAEGGCVVPSTIEEERATNPFMRPGAPELLRRVAELAPGADLSTGLGVFAATRRLKDAL